MFPSERTKAEKGEWFTTAIDRDQKSFSIHGPTMNEDKHLEKVIAEKNSSGRDIQAGNSFEGPRYAEAVRQEMVGILPGYDFVDSAVAKNQTKITVSNNPLK